MHQCCQAVGSPAAPSASRRSATRYAQSRRPAADEGHIGLYFDIGGERFGFFDERARRVYR